MAWTQPCVGAKRNLQKFPLKTPLIYVNSNLKLGVINSPVLEGEHHQTTHSCMISSTVNGKYQSRSPIFIEMKHNFFCKDHLQTQNKSITFSHITNSMKRSLPYNRLQPHVCSTAQVAWMKWGEGLKNINTYFHLKVLK